MSVKLSGPRTPTTMTTTTLAQETSTIFFCPCFDKEVHARVRVRANIFSLMSSFVCFVNGRGCQTANDKPIVGVVKRDDKTLHHWAKPAPTTTPIVSAATAIPTANTTTTTVTSKGMDLPCPLDLLTSQQNRLNIKIVTHGIHKATRTILGKRLELLLYHLIRRY